MWIEINRMQGEFCAHTQNKLLDKCGFCYTILHRLEIAKCWCFALRYANGQTCCAGRIYEDAHVPCAYASANRPNRIPITTVAATPADDPADTPALNARPRDTSSV